MTTRSRVDWLNEIAQCNDLTVRGEQQKIKAIRGARRAGYGWSQIGDAMGMSRQAAAYRYERYVEVD